MSGAGGYVPSLGQVADWVNRNQPVQWPEGIIDRLISAHDARIASEAAERELREAADDYSNPASQGAHLTPESRTWLTARADRLAAERKGRS